MKLDDVLEFIEENASDYEMMKKVRLAADKNVKAINSKSLELKKPKYSTEAMEIAESLKSQVIERYPFMEAKINVEKWAEDIQRMNSLDNIDWKHIEAVMDWSQEDDFWRQQVRSGANLRKHYDTMLIRAGESFKGVFKV